MQVYYKIGEVMFENPNESSKNYLILFLELPEQRKDDDVELMHSQEQFFLSYGCGSYKPTTLAGPDLLHWKSPYSTHLANVPRYTKDILHRV